MSAETEEWRAVVGFEGFYEVSDWGRVRGLDRRVPRNGHTVFTRGVMLKPGRAANGYLTVSICGDTHLVQELVLTAFQRDSAARLYWKAQRRR